MQPKKQKQTIDNYRFSSGEDPSDEILEQLMKQVSKEAKQKADQANLKFQQEFQELIRQTREKKAKENEGK